MERCYAFPALLLLAATTNAQIDPVLHWRLDEEFGTVAHDVEYTVHGILQNGTQWDPTGGHHQGACRFDGVDDLILTGPCDITTGTGFSLSIWVKPDFVTAMDRTLIIKSVGPDVADHIWSIAFVNATALRFNLRTGAGTTELLTAPSSVFSGSWYHVAAAYDGATMRLWLNGALMAETSITGSMGYHPEAPASIGALSTGAAAFSGWIDDVRIFDLGLTEDDVISILLEDEVPTQVDADPPWIGSDSRLHLPPGNWTELRLLDAAGREVATEPLAGRGNALDLAPLSTGLYLVTLSSGGKRASWPMVVP